MTTTVATTNGNHAQAEASETDKKILAELARKVRVDALRANGWKVELGAGTATLIDPRRLPERKAKAIKLAMMRSSRDGENVDPEPALEAGYVLCAAFLDSWTVDLPLPSVANTDPFLDLVAVDYRKLSDAVADIKPEAFPDYDTPSEADLTPAADKTSPFTSGSA